jgi:DNA replication protein DnaC
VIADKNEDPQDDELHPNQKKALKLQDGSGFLHKRLTRKIIRFRHYGRRQDPSNYYREQLMLFLPWRDEEHELLLVNTTEQFQKYNNVVLSNSKPFYFDREVDDLILQDIVDETQEEINNCDENDEVLGSNLSLIQEDDFYEADVEEEKSENVVVRVEQFLPPRLVTEPEYLNIMRALNEKQRRFVLNVLNLLKTSKEPFYYFLSGGAGVGKSHAITAIVQSYMRYNCLFPPTHPEDICVLVAAPTGKAAFNVFGMTLHCTFKLPPNQAGGKLCDLDSSALNTLRTKLFHVNLFIIDEISMVSNRQFYDIDQRLRQIFSTTKDFGGKSVIAVGHLRQLAPVAGTYVFKPPKHIPLGLCVGNHLWHKFSLFELDEVMRQKGDLAFCNALNNMAEGTMKDEDIKLIKSREVNENNAPPDFAINLFATNEECRVYNASVHQKLKTDGILSVAFDRVQGIRITQRRPR